MFPIEAAVATHKQKPRPLATPECRNAKPRRPVALTFRTLGRWHQEKTPPPLPHPSVPEKDVLTPPQLPAHVGSPTLKNEPGVSHELKTIRIQVFIFQFEEKHKWFVLSGWERQNRVGSLPQKWKSETVRPIAECVIERGRSPGWETP